MIERNTLYMLLWWHVVGGRLMKDVKFVFMACLFSLLVCVLKPQSVDGNDLSFHEAKKISERQLALTADESAKLRRMIAVYDQEESQFSRDELLGLLLGHSSQTQLQEYKANPDDTIAVHAAWEEVKRSARVPLIKQIYEKPEDMDLQPLVKIQRAPAQRFLGFVEGRLGVPLPKWWEGRFLRAYLSANSPDGISFDHDDMDESSADKGNPYRAEYHDEEKTNRQGSTYTSRTWFRYLLDIDQVVPPFKGGVKVTWDEFSYTVPEEIQKKALDRHAYPSVGFSGWLNNDYFVFAFHGDYATGYRLYCVDRKSMSVVWSSEVRSYFHGGISGPGFFHYVEMRVKDNVLYVFGTDFVVAYIEAFSLKDGTPVMQFSTNYAIDIESHRAKDE